MATAPRTVYLHRFSRTERALHWVHASAFFVLLGTGLVLYLPRLSEVVGRRPLVKDVHFYTGVGWAVAILLIAAAGDGPGCAERRASSTSSTPTTAVGCSGGARRRAASTPARS